MFLYWPPSTQKDMLAILVKTLTFWMPLSATLFMTAMNIAKLLFCRNRLQTIIQTGGWTFGESDGDVTSTVWFNNKAIHSMPAYLNGLNNLILKANIEGPDRDKYGRYLHILAAQELTITEISNMQYFSAGS